MTTNRYRALVAAAFLVSVLVGVWRGVASCGGYVWHSHATLAVLATGVLSLVLIEPSHGVPFWRRAVLAVAFIAAFLVARALSAPFYPAFPGFGEYFRQVGVALDSELC